MGMMAVYIGGTGLFLLFVLMYSRGRRAKTKVVHVIEKRCVGCGRCAGRCKHQVLSVIISDRKRCVTVSRPEQCTACGHCMKECRFNALELISRNRNNNG